MPFRRSRKNLNLNSAPSTVPLLSRSVTSKRALNSASLNARGETVQEHPTNIMEDKFVPEPHFEVQGTPELLAKLRGIEFALENSKTRTYSNPCSIVEAGNFRHSILNSFRFLLGVARQMSLRQGDHHHQISLKSCLRDGRLEPPFVSRSSFCAYESQASAFVPVALHPLFSV